jgi:hypothetical protein
MKRLFQCVCTLVVVLLAGHPVLEELACSLHMGDGRAACSMAMSEMSPDCPMAGQRSQAGCVQSCCNHALPQTAVLLSAPAKPKSVAAAVLTLAGLTLPHPHLAYTPRRATAAAASSPPIHLLNRVFRI